MSTKNLDCYQNLFIILIFIIIFSTTAFSESIINPWSVNKQDEFNDVGVPFSDALTMWVGRQAFTLNAYQINMNADLPAESINLNHLNFNIESYLPLYHNDNFSSMVCFHPLTSSILSDDIDMRLFHNWFWLAASYTVNKWKFIITAENYLNGNNTSFLRSSTGDVYIPLLTIGYEINTFWRIMVIGGFSRTYMADTHIDQPVAAIQAYFQPSNTFKLLFGAPVLFDLEWTLSRYFQFIGKLEFFGGLSSESLIRYRINNSISVNLHYIGYNNLTGITYFNNEIFKTGDRLIIFNNLQQYTYSTLLELSTKVSKNVALIFFGGYRIGGNIDMYNNKDLVNTIGGKNEYFIKATIQYLSFM